MQKQFNRNFGIIPSIEEEREAFINRSNQFLYEFIRGAIQGKDYYSFFSTVCFQIGLNPMEVIRKNYGQEPEINEILPRNFFNTLRIILAVRNYYKNNPSMLSNIDNAIHDILNSATIDIGIIYKSGMFFPKGEELLDKELIEYSLRSLEGFSNENKDLLKALDNYRKDSRSEVIVNCYLCIEGFTRQILKNNKTLIDNKAEIIKSTGLSDHWKKILGNYIEYGNDGRHASENRHNFNKAEVEAYLYTTCVLIRLIMQINK